MSDDDVAEDLAGFAFNDDSTDVVFRAPDGSDVSVRMFADGTVDRIATFTDPSTGVRTITRRTNNGDETTTRIALNGDRDTVRRSQDGTFRENVEHTRDGTIVTTTTRPDGTVTFRTEDRSPDGTVERVTRFSDGTHETDTTTTQGDGSQLNRTVARQGEITEVETTILRDGQRRETRSPDGSRTVVEETGDAAGNARARTTRFDAADNETSSEVEETVVRELPDGSTVTEQSSSTRGVTTTTRRPDGSFEEVARDDAGGVRTVTRIVQPDGSIVRISTDAQGNRTELVQQVDDQGFARSRHTLPDGTVVDQVSTPDGALRSSRTNRDGSTEVTEMGTDGSGSVDRVDAQGNQSTELLESDLRRGSGGVRDLDDVPGDPDTPPPGVEPGPAPLVPGEVRTSHLANGTEADFVTEDGTRVHVNVDADGVVTRQTEDVDPETGARSTTTRTSNGFDEVRVTFPDGREQLMRQQPDGTSFRIDTLPQPDGSIRTDIFEDSPFPTSTEITTFDADGNERTVRTFGDGRPDELETVTRVTDAEGRTIVAETAADGTLDIRTTQLDGSVENVRVLPDGSRESDTRTPLPGGGERSELRRSDGTVEVSERTVEGAGVTRTEHRVLDRDGNVTSTSVTDVRVDVDGTQTTETVDGSSRSVSVVRPDGTSDSRSDFADGTSSTVVRTREADGGFTQVATGQDGGVTETRQRTGPNGEAQLVVTRPDGTTAGAEITSDGAVSAGRVAPDGTRTRSELNPDGSGQLQQFDAEGNQTDGREVAGDDAFGPDAVLEVRPVTAMSPASTNPTDPTVPPASGTGPASEDTNPTPRVLEEPLDPALQSAGTPAADAGGLTDVFDEPDLFVNRIREQSEDSNVDHRPSDPLTPTRPQPERAFDIEIGPAVFEEPERVFDVEIGPAVFETDDNSLETAGLGAEGLLGHPEGTPIVDPNRQPSGEFTGVGVIGPQGDDPGPFAGLGARGEIEDPDAPQDGPFPDDGTEDAFRLRDIIGRDDEPLIRPDPDARPLDEPLRPMDVDVPDIEPAPTLDEQPIDLGIIHDTPLPTVPEPDFGDDVEPLIGPDPDARPLEPSLVPMEVDPPDIEPAPTLDEFIPDVEEFIPDVEEFIPDVEEFMPDVPDAADVADE